MRKIFLVAILCSAAMLGTAQTAKIKHLSDANTVEASTAYANLQKAQKDWDAVQKKIGKTYFAKGESWQFEFTEDFKAIVPMQMRWNSSGGITLTTSPCSLTTTTSVPVSTGITTWQ